MAVCTWCNTEIINESDICELGGRLACPTCFEDSFTCEWCGEDFAHSSTGTHTVGENDVVCDSCYDAHSSVCENCGTVGHSDDYFYIDSDDTMVCQNCFEHHYFTCEHCESSTHIDNRSLEYEDDWICQSCADTMTTCTCHGRRVGIDSSHVLILEDSVYCSDYEGLAGLGYYFCQHCSTFHNIEEECIGKYVKEYMYKPQPIFYGSGFHYGVELEIRVPKNEYKEPTRFINIIKEVSEFYIKKDGSIDNGYELVSHPCTIEHFQSLKPVFDNLNSEFGELNGADEDLCGYHVHVSRNQFGNTVENQNNNIAKLIWLFDTNYKFMIKFSRRNQYKYQQWSDVTFSNSECSMLKDMCTNTSSVYPLFRFLTHKSANNNRRKAVNIQNLNTIEIRCPKGTVDYSEIIATLQFLEIVIEKCKSSSLIELANLNLYSMCIDSDKKELSDYVKKIQKNKDNQPLCADAERTYPYPQF